MHLPSSLSDSLSLSFSDDIKKAVERPVTEVGKREIKGIRRNFTAAIKKKRTTERTKEAIQSSYRERDGGKEKGTELQEEGRTTEKFCLYLTVPRGSSSWHA